MKKLLLSAEKATEAEEEVSTKWRSCSKRRNITTEGKEEATFSEELTVTEKAHRI